MVSTQSKRIVLAGGCFWGVQDLFRKQPGIISTRVGYTGGRMTQVNYCEVKTGATGHVEAVEVIYDPSVTCMSDILAFFFQIHDPTTLNRQGNDRGSQYRSAIFYSDDEQRQMALDLIMEIEKSGLWPGKVVTEVLLEQPFWEAEPEHQDYLERYPNGYTCHYVRPDWQLPSS